MNKADKRSVSTDALETLGNLIDENQKRDAIHIAVEPVVAACSLMPGDDVGFVTGGVGLCDNPVGIVDPFIHKNTEIKRGDRFWLLVYPRQITSLRHVWSHPKFQEEKDKEEDTKIKNEAIKLAEVNDVLDTGITSRQFMQNFANEIGVSYADLISHARDYNNNSSDYWCEGDKFMNVGMPDGFWERYHRLTGDKLSDHVTDTSTYGGNFFSCSC